MTLSTLFRATLSTAGLPIYRQLRDSTRMVTAYRDGETLVVAFGCTLGPVTGPDWARNFDLWPVWFEGILAPRGWVRELVSLIAWVRDVIVDTRPEFIRLCGYSQGGPHASLMAHLLAKTWGPRLYLDAFADPAGFYPLFDLIARARLRYWRVHVRRWVVSGDPVPGLPPWCRHLAPAEVLGQVTALPSAALHEPESYVPLLEEWEQRFEK